MYYQPYPFEQPKTVTNDEQRLIPFIGGALIGGLGGAAIASNRYQPMGYYYPTYYYPTYPTYYYPYATYYGYPGSMGGFYYGGGATIPSTGTTTTTTTKL